MSKRELIVVALLLILTTAPLFYATKIKSISLINENSQTNASTIQSTLIKTEIEITKDTTSQTFTGTVSQGYDSQRHSFTVDSSVTKIEVYLYMPSGTDFDLSVWDPSGRRTGGWTSTDHSTRTDIPNSQYSGYSANPEYVIVDPVSTTGTWYVGCYAYSGSGEYQIKVTLYTQSNEPAPSPPATFTGTVSGDGSTGPHYNSPNSVAWAEHAVTLTSGTEYSVTLDWDSSSDLDLYVYKPGTAPSQDGGGSDYVTRAYTTNKPETLTFTADVDGEWILAVDHYSSSGTASYTLTIDVVGGGGGGGGTGPYSWIFAVYLDADNNLDSYGVSDLNEMMQVGSTSEVGIIVLMDRASSGAYIYYVNSGSTTTLESLGEVNMGDPNTLNYFANYITSNYQADHYALILWDHGGGWVGACWDDSNGNDHLTLDEIQQALSGYHFDLIGFDACLMATIETAYELRNIADVLVASEETEPGDGWPYDTILSALTQNPSMTVADLGTTIVQKYADYYGSSGSETMAAIDLTKVGDLASALDQLAKELANGMTGSSTSQTFTGTVSQGYDSQRHSFTVDSSVTKIEVYLYMPSGTDFDLSVWDPSGRRTGGWTSTDHSTRTDIPNSQYSGYSANPEYVIVDPVSTTGTWYTGCYSYSGSGEYQIKVTLYYGGGYKSAIDNVLANVEYFSSSKSADIYHFAYLVKQYISDATVQNYAQQVMDALVAAVISEFHGSGHPNAHGLDVYFPKTSSDYDSSYTSSGLDFVADTYWDEFLNAYYSA